MIYESYANELAQKIADCYNALGRVRDLYEHTLKATVNGCSDDLEMFLSDLRQALDGEQE
jgi:lipopolysaccharide biosynthesis regulator YciM